MGAASILITNRVIPAMELLKILTEEFPNHNTNIDYKQYPEHPILNGHQGFVDFNGLTMFYIENSLDHKGASYFSLGAYNIQEVREIYHKIAQYTGGEFTPNDCDDNIPKEYIPQTKDSNLSKEDIFLGKLAPKFGLETSKEIINFLRENKDSLEELF